MSSMSPGRQARIMSLLLLLLVLAGVGCSAGAQPRAPQSRLADYPVPG